MKSLMRLYSVNSSLWTQSKHHDNMDAIITHLNMLTIEFFLFSLGFSAAHSLEYGKNFFYWFDAYIAKSSVFHHKNDFTLKKPR